MSPNSSNVSPHHPDSETIKMGSAISKSTLKVFGPADGLLKFIKATYNKKGNVTYEIVMLEDVLDVKLFSSLRSPATPRPAYWSIANPA